MASRTTTWGSPAVTRGRVKEAYDAFYKATWNSAWRAPAYLALAECDAARQNWRTAVDHLQRSLRADADNLNARNLLAIILRKLGDTAGADEVLDETLALIRLTSVHDGREASRPRTARNASISRSTWHVPGYSGMRAVCLSQRIRTHETAPHP